MYAYCEEHGLPVERCGKLVVACNEKEHEQVEKLYRQGTANGVKGLKIIYDKEVCHFRNVFSSTTTLYSLDDKLYHRLRKWNPMSRHTVRFIPPIRVLSITGLSVNASPMKSENQGKLIKL